MSVEAAAREAAIRTLEDTAEEFAKEARNYERQAVGSLAAAKAAHQLERAHRIAASDLRLIHSAQANSADKSAPK